VKQGIFSVSHHDFQHRFDSIIVEFDAFYPAETAEAVIMFDKVPDGFTQLFT
jgi:hypothetical protein